MLSRRTLGGRDVHIDNTAEATHARVGLHVVSDKQRGGLLAIAGFQAIRQLENDGSGWCLYGVLGQHTIKPVLLAELDITAFQIVEDLVKKKPGPGGEYVGIAGSRLRNALHAFPGAPA